MAVPPAASTTVGRLVVQLLLEEHPASGRGEEVVLEAATAAHEPRHQLEGQAVQDIERAEKRQLRLSLIAASEWVGLGGRSKRRGLPAGTSSAAHPLTLSPGNFFSFRGAVDPRLTTLSHAGGPRVDLSIRRVEVGRRIVVEHGGPLARRDLFVPSSS